MGVGRERRQMKGRSGSSGRATGPWLRGRFERWVERGAGYHVLLVLLFWMLLAQPGGRSGPNPSLVGTLVTTGVFAVALVAVAGNRKVLIVGGVLLVPSVIFAVFEVSTHWSQSLVGQGAALAFLALITWTFMCRIFSQQTVTGATLSAAACVYLFLGIAWSFAYQMVATLEPASFTGLVDPQRELFYFSFVTLTTLGFGDITPASPTARALVMVEALAGQLFLVITIARLVTLYGHGIRVEGPGGVPTRHPREEEESGEDRPD